jgi:predicted nucleotidyltransferase component of viral defense system
VIPLDEFRETARNNEVPISTIERDYAQNWLLKYLPEMAFKGGTCIRKIYIDNYRFSDDLDFTLKQGIDLESLTKNIKNSVQKAGDESGIDFLEDIKSDKVENGYVFNVYFRIIRTTGNPLKIKIDVTKHDKELIVDELKTKKINHIYSDSIDGNLEVYSLKEIFAEKIRSLFERTRPRDLYDVWHLSSNVKFDNSLFRKKCEFKKLTPITDELFARKTDFIDSWQNSLKHQLKELPNANNIFENVIKFLEKNI